MAPPHSQTATVTGGDQNIVVQNTGSHVVIQVEAHRLQAYTHPQYLSGYQSDGERGLLIAQLQRIPFYLPPREPDLLQLRAWLDSPPTISIRTLLGRAGTGKTRTAVEFVNREQSRADWNFGWLSEDELQRFIQHASFTGKIWTGNVCLILDYASASVDSLKKLLQQGLVHAQAGPGKLRLLLLDRSDAGWYASLLPLGNQQDAVKALFAGNDPRRLPSFIDVEHRRALLVSAVTHFRALNNQSDLTLPAPGEDPLFDQRLKNAELGVPASANEPARNLALCFGAPTRGLEISRLEVRLLRELAAAQPEAFRPDLASALNNEANRLSEVGQRAEALLASNQAVDHPSRVGRRSARPVCSRLGAVIRRLGPNLRGRAPVRVVTPAVPCFPHRTNHKRI